MNESRYREAERALWASVGATPTERMLRLPTVRTTVRVQELGAADGPTVLFVHGASNAGTSWAPLAARLGELRCVLLDRPGCGLSQPLDGRLVDVDRLASFSSALVADVLDGVGVAGGAAVVSTSFGGYIGLRAAAALPELVTRSVVIGWPIGAPILRTPVAMRIAAAPGLQSLMLRVPPSERMVRAMLKNIGLRHAVETGGFSQVAVDWFRSLLRDTDTMRNELRALPPIMTALKGINESILLGDDVLGSISTPVAFLWGADDPMGGADTARAFVPRIPGATLEVMADAGHAPWMDDADHVAAFVRRSVLGGS